jgi:hypothetical protein
VKPGDRFERDRILPLTKANDADVERLAMALAWDDTDTDERKAYRQRAQNVIVTLAKVQP